MLTNFDVQIPLVN